MLHTKFHGNRSIGSREDFLKGFYHIWAWRPSVSCDPDLASKLFVPHTQEGPYKISLSLGRKKIYIL